jgi:drug/metabolite transporter (DMT)-like permease
MKVNRIRQNVFPVLAAFIWGTAFVAQSVGADYVEPFTFNAARSAVAFLFLLVLCILLRLRRKRDFRGEAKPVPAAKKNLLLGGLCCGVALTLAANLQQKGLETTSSGKAGFITALYIVIVPIAGVFLKKKAPRAIWASVALAVVGLYCLCIKEDLSVSAGDFYMLLCALCFSAHILIIDHFTQKVDGVELSCAQFLVVSVLSASGMLATESPTVEALRLCLGPILYVGIFSSGVAYTLQILAQKDSNPTVVSLLLSLEAVFATLAGAIVLGDRMSGKEYVGCVLMLVAVVLAQLPASREEQPQEEAALDE